LWQANYLQAALAENGLESTIHIIKTKGDQIQHLSFDKIEGKGFFTKEIEDALLEGKVDLAVHSMKDLPTSSPEGLSITGVSYREDPADWLLIRKDRAVPNQLMQLPEGAVVGTSSSRRQSQLLHFRSDLLLKDIRGNVPTRIEKLRSGDFDAIVLAGAGIKRLKLDISDLIVVKFNPQEFVPAPAQGVLAYQVRTEDTALRRKLLPLHQKKVADCTNVERQVLKLMNGGCQMPLGVYCEQDSLGNYHLWAAWASGAKEALTTVNLSSSTRFELAEKTVAALRDSTKMN
jgi:hydroxymethylbilane synthase